jgi:transcriptional regulator with XRE-family HTH domain
MTQPAGSFLRTVRERLGLTVRDVQEASALIAAEEKSPDFAISAARLSQIENEPSAPSVAKLFTLSAVYGLDFVELLAHYGVNPDRVHHYREQLKLPSTHPIALEAHNLATRAMVPVRLDPSFRWETTQLLNRVVALWGELPAVLLQALNPRRNVYAFIGLRDFTMYPILRPGALVMVDGSQRRVARGGWTSEYNRPIYFVELRDGYRCAWCQQNGGQITLVPHPMSTVPSESYCFPGEAEVVGRVVGVAMRLVRAESPDPDNGTAHPTQLSSVK